MKEIKVIEKEDGHIEVDLAPGMYYDVIEESKSSSIDPRIKVTTAKIGGQVVPVSVKYPNDYSQEEIMSHADELLDQIPFCSSCERNKRLVLKMLMDHIQKNKTEKGSVPEVPPVPQMEVPPQVIPEAPPQVEQQVTIIPEVEVPPQGIPEAPPQVFEQQTTFIPDVEAPLPVIPEAPPQAMPQPEPSTVPMVKPLTQIVREEKTKIQQASHTVSQSPPQAPPPLPPQPEKPKPLVERLRDDANRAQIEGAKALQSAFMGPLMLKPPWVLMAERQQK